MVDVLFVTGFAAAGLLVGSAVNAAMLRWVGWRVLMPQLVGALPGSDALSDAPPRCRSCGAPLAPLALPLIAWLPSRGRCRGEGRHRIDTRYLVLEVTMASLWAVAGAVHGRDLVVVPVLVLVTGLVAMAAVDIWVMRIPNRFVYTTHALLVTSIVAVSLAEGEPGALAGAALGGVAYFGFLFLFFVVSPRRMGFGDVRLAGVMGVALGWLGWFDNATDPVRQDLWVAPPLVWVVWGALAGSILGTLLGLVTLVARRGSRPFPFGPSLVAGCLLVVLAPDLVLG